MQCNVPILSGSPVHGVHGAFANESCSGTPNVPFTTPDTRLRGHENGEHRQFSALLPLLRYSIRVLTTTMTVRTRHRWEIVCFSVAILLGGFYLVRNTYADFSHHIQGDGNLYFTVGRGILNGLRPYRDLFESKPPGIFLIAAFSQLLGGTILARLLYALAYAVIPFLSPRRAPFLILLVLFSQPATFASLQPEAFGAAFGSLYIWGVLHVSGRWRIPLASFCLLLSVGMKEPFLLALFAGFLLTKRPLKEFAFHLTLAAVVGLSLLFILGYVGPYFQLYLPVMFENRITGGEPLLLRGLLIRMLLRRFNDPGFFLGWLLAALWLYRGRFPFLLGAALMHFGFIFFKVIAIVGLPLKAPFFLAISSAYLIASVVFLLIADRDTYRYLAALYFLVLAAHVGVSLPLHHLVMTLPAFVALIMTTNNRRVLTLLALVGILAYTPLPVSNASAPASDPELDRVMTDCGVDRFASLPLGSGPFLNTHSPMGPVVVQAIARLLGQDHPLVQQTLANLSSADIILTQGTHWYFGIDLADWLKNNFTDIPPQCAGELSRPDMLFRRRYPPQSSVS